MRRPCYMRVTGPALVALLLAVGAAPATGLMAPQIALAGVRLEIQAEMLQGTIEIVDQDDLSVVVRTDTGRLLLLSIPDCEVIGDLRRGDRVRLETDRQGFLTVTKVDHAVSGEEPVRATSGVGRCAGKDV